MCESRYAADSVCAIVISISRHRFSNGPRRSTGPGLAAVADTSAGAAMKRRAFLAATGAVAAASSFPAPAISQGIRELKLVLSWPIDPTSDLLARLIEGGDQRTLQGQGLRRWRAGGRFRGFRCGLSRGGGDVLVRRLLLAGPLAGVQFLHDRALWAECAGDLRLDLRGPRPSAVGRVERELRHQAAACRQQRGADGRLVQQGDDVDRRFQGAAHANAGTGRRSRSAARRGGGEPVRARYRPGHEVRCARRGGVDRTPPGLQLRTS